VSVSPPLPPSPARYVQRASKSSILCLARPSRTQFCDIWLDTALAQPVADPVGYPVLSRPYLILLKLQAGRTQDLADVQRLLARVPQPERDAMRQIVLRYAPDLAEDYDALCTLADLEFGPSPDQPV